MAVTTTHLRAKLKRHFGFHDFRPGQVQAVRAALEGRDTVVIMPTGSGKSLCFQLPALELKGTTIVVSPLIALMKDQVDTLRSRGMMAHEVNSTLSTNERRVAEYSIAIGEPQFVYTTPEQLANEDFRAILRRQPIDLFVVDEAHCVSHWGHDFRPEYLALGQVIETLGRPPVLALTATSTDETLSDIKSVLRIPEAEIIHTGFYRPNIDLAVTRTIGEGEKRLRLLEEIRKLDGSGIVYTATIKAVEELTRFLEDQGIVAEGYHGKMPAKIRAAAQERFMSGEVNVIVATNAFGLGIDKPDIRFVIHYHLPGTIEAFYQEFGRAGRDGEHSSGLLLFDPDDTRLQRFFTSRKYPDESDLVNAYHALSRLHQAGEIPKVDAIVAICPLTKSRLKTCLDLFVNRQIVEERSGGRFALLKEELDRSALVSAGQRYREREERDQMRHRKMLDYATEPVCRWRTVLSYFESDELTENRCGHCDCC